MRHARLIVILCVAVVITFTAVCFRALFSVSDVVAEYSVYNQNEAKNANQLLSTYNGKSLLFISEKEVTDLINANTNLKVEKFTKKYPNQIEISLKERKECYAVKTAEGYVLLDEEYCVVAKRSNCLNYVDNLENVVLEFGNSEFNAENLIIRKKLTIGNSSLLDSTLAMLDGLENPRDYIQSISIVEKEKGVNYYAYLKTKEGVELEIRKFTDKPSEKINVAMTKYFTLKDSERIANKIAVYSLESGSVTAIYTKQNEG